ncbi:hypothetical protein APHAL10511_000430 [Amanita phalloides]|nr:hypothetical protein APHAL10511_000430 [Amanita phalloides]
MFSLPPPHDRISIAGERRPLLSDATDAQITTRKSVSSWKPWVSCGLTLILVSAAVGFFIKALIDSGDVHFDWQGALKRSVGGGLSGAAAMVLQVLTLMPLRTVTNYQYRYGTTTTQAIRTLNADGGLARFYQGMSAALIQGPLSRFGDTAANVGVLALLQSNPFTREFSTLFKTLFASLVAAAFRTFLTPIDTVKTTMQTEGKAGMPILKNRIKKYGISTLWYGAMATAAAAFVGHYPWFSAYNYLDDNLPSPHTPLEKLSRRAFIGFMASICSDPISNFLRVLKTYKQVCETHIGYLDAARAVVLADGWRGLLGRGLKTRILTNGLQGLMFSVLWKMFMDMWS